MTKPWETGAKIAGPPEGTRAMLIAKAFLCAGGDGNDDDSDDDDTKLSFIDRLILPGIILAIFNITWHNILTRIQLKRF